PTAPVFAKAKATANGVSGQVEPDMWVEVVRHDTGAKLCSVKADAKGNWTCQFASKVPHGIRLDAIAVEKRYQTFAPSQSAIDMANHTFASIVASIQVKANGPSEPEPKPSDGSELTGTVPGYDPNVDGPLDLTVRDKVTGKVICTTTVNPDGSWRCTPSSKLDEGTMVLIEVVDEAGNVATKPWRIGLPRMVVVTSPIRVGQSEKVEGYNFQPGETVQATQYSDPYVVGIQEADKNGKVVWSYIIQIGTVKGQHSMRLVGNQSGRVESKFEVADDQGPKQPPTGQATTAVPSVDPLVPTGPAPTGSKPGSKGNLPFTGSDSIGLIGAALGALLAGLLLLLARRREEEESIS
ncbi:MAG: Ig-like domain-containing protein, partial [Micrococcales bacterium]|nr:Ig-like domain-containing protein [Micrococcales bacterium]